VGLLVTGTGWSRAFLLVAIAPVAAAFVLRPILERRPTAEAARQLLLR
jgi:hypothetical protein